MALVDWYDSWEPTQDQRTFPHCLQVDVPIAEVIEVLDGLGLTFVSEDGRNRDGLRAAGDGFEVRLHDVAAGALGLGVLEGPLPPTVAVFVTGRSGFADRNAVEAVRRYLEQRTPWRIELQNKYFQEISVRDRVGQIGCRHGD
ncbi:hypothetical protein FK531_20440 [Rhodococcus spelaei]|uniref:Uncharacterized protein n=1 Tax=Rhodococcus spelaei TaxID=2546320 RepID=A0A541B0E9_9NOCA|nr:hypothetical protein [Rhodococcus spelaei]TQF65797.1 hypothetical protein FK531_20440 [Rhodococcus spelaei]